jgi:hypothetical protein
MEKAEIMLRFFLSPICYFYFDRFCIGDSLWRMIEIALTAELKKK